jgi:hypothetical protein
MVKVSYDSKLVSGSSLYTFQLRAIDYPLEEGSVTMEMVIGGGNISTFHFEESIDLPIGKHTIDFGVLVASGVDATWSARISVNGKPLASGEFPTYVKGKWSPIRATFLVLPGGIVVPFRIPSIGVIPSFVGPLQRVRKPIQYTRSITIDELWNRSWSSIRQLIQNGNGGGNNGDGNGNGDDEGNGNGDDEGNGNGDDEGNGNGDDDDTQSTPIQDIINRMRDRLNIFTGE